MRAWREVLRLAGARPARLAAAVALGSLAVLAGVALVGLSGYLICRAAQQPPILSLTVVIVVVRALALTRPLARYGERLVGHDLAFRMLGHLRGVCFEQIEPLAPAELEAYRDGELLARLVRDIDEIQDLVLRVLLPAAIAAVTAPVIVVALAILLPQAAVVATIGLATALLVTPLAARRAAARGRERQLLRRGELTAEVIEALDAADELWLCGADALALDRIRTLDAELVAASRDDARGAGVAEALGQLLAGGTTIGVLVVASAAAVNGTIDPLAVAPLTLVTMGAFELVAPVAVGARSIDAVRVAVARVLDLMARRPGVTDPHYPVPPPQRPTDLGVDGLVAERGPAGNRVVVLDGVDLGLDAGERLVVRGPSGSGKSTLLHVLVRFLERSAGSVRLADHDVREHGQADVRAAVLLCEQDPHVFDSNLRENVAFARPGSSDEAIRAALDRAQLGAWLAQLPDGLDTRVGDGGRALSGGQRQRLALARAFLADPAILLLDEPTAHLDGPTADALLDDLWALGGDRSVLLVTHGDAGPFGRVDRIELA